LGHWTVSADIDLGGDSQIKIVEHMVLIASQGLSSLGVCPADPHHSYHDVYVHDVYVHEPVFKGGR
jgi:hypothetical protein